MSLEVQRTKEKGQRPVGIKLSFVDCPLSFFPAYASISIVEYRRHARTTGNAIKHWFIATCYDALCVGTLWLIGLLIIGVPWAPLWAILGGLLQFVPGIGAVIALIGPAFAILLSDGSMMRLIYLLILYVVVVLVDGLSLQPYFMKRSARVPLWASILTPLACAIFLPFWGVLLAPPILAVIYAFRAQWRDNLRRDLEAEQQQRVLDSSQITPDS
jgi:predicted PurR-regulated permease PerM